MNIRKHLTMTLALTALTLGLTTTQAMAQSAMKGSFELPRAMYFGDTLLPAGQYNVWMSTEAQDLAKVSAIHLSGEGVTKTFLAISTSRRETNRNCLEIADMGGVYVVRAFDSGTLGKSFGFGVTKNVKMKALDAQARPSISIPVSSGANF
jgi:hypothetical protein